ncbi:MAG: hypothetical protein JNL08_00375 [Planctomycetes bacterium]|nr:hypothetical protein [Planctomycetota bacterium]
MQGNPPGVLRLVLVPALLTLVITVLRLVGQIQGWNPTIFGRPEAGGGGAVLGISWLIFVFGLWFGIRLQRSGAGPKAPGRALLTSVIAIAVVFGGMAALQAAGVMWFPDEQNPGEPRGLGWMLGLMACGCLVAALAWGRAALVLLVYGLLARIPVVIVTLIALGQVGWTTHYTQIPPFFTNVAEADRAQFLLMPQLTFWPGLTVLFGTAMASLGALLSGRKRAA